MPLVPHPLSVETEAFAALLALRGAFPGAGLDVLCPRDELALRAATHVGLIRRRLTIPYVETAREGSACRYYAIEPDTHPPLASFLAHRLEASRFISPGGTPMGRQVSRQAADIVALALSYPMRMETELGWASLLRQVGEDLFPVRPLGWVDRLYELMEARRNVIERAGAFGAAWSLEPTLSPALSAFTAGKRLRESSRVDLALIWFDLAREIGREEADWEAVARAWGGIGKARKLRGAYPAARSAFLRSLVVASRYGLEGDVLGFAYHDLASLAIERGDVYEAYRLAHLSLAAYPSRSRYRLNLAHDVAFGLVRERRYESARALLTPVVRQIPPDDVPLRMMGFATLAHACAGAGSLAAYREAFDAAWRLAFECPDSQERASAFIALGRAALLQGERHRCQMAADLALATAEAHHEGKAIIEAEELLASAFAADHTAPPSAGELYVWAAAEIGLLAVA